VGTAFPLLWDTAEKLLAHADQFWRIKVNRTALYECYASISGVKFLEFEGWQLPLQFDQGIVAEHHAVRNAAGIFDVSHMGRILIQGPGSSEYVDWLTTSVLPALDSNHCRYTFLCDENGRCIDDILVYRRAAESFELVVNAANRTAVLSWITESNPWIRKGKIVPLIVDCTAQTVQIALQGPAAVKILSSLCDSNLTHLGYYRFIQNVLIAGIPAMISRTGYTGEDGFELYVAAQDGCHLWQSIVGEGKPYGLALCGLGARDTLRFEAGLPLYGHEIGKDINAFESSLERFIDMAKSDFSGRAALLALTRSGAQRKRIGLEMIDSAVPRAGYSVYQGGKACGHVTSGGKCPTVGIFAAMALVSIDVNESEIFEIDIRGKRKQARARKLPFYTKRKDPTHARVETMDAL
jgi:aminomethyltransferase